MKPCPRCEAPCPDRTIVCPHCGYLFSAEMQDTPWKEAPRRPDMRARRPRTPARGDAQPTDTGAMLSLAFGLAAFAGAWYIAGIPLAIPGLLCGLAARRRIQKAAGARGGELSAQAGIVLSVLALGVGLCLLGWAALHWPEFYRDFPSRWDSTVQWFRS